MKEGIDAFLPQIGDFVMPADGYGGPDQRVTIEVSKRNQAKLSKRCREGKAWIAGLFGQQPEQCNNRRRLQRPLRDFFVVPGG